MARNLTAALVALTWAVLSGTSLHAIRPRLDSPSTKTVAEPAGALDRGLKRLTRADEQEARKPGRGRKDYQAALADFQSVLTRTPDDYRALTGAGYAYRKLGQYDRALASYDRALTIAPSFTEAIEYRAEAYLGLNRLDEVKQAYMRLFVDDRAASGMLMNAMKTWLQANRVPPPGVDAAAFGAFEAWVRERDALAASVVNLGHNSPGWR